MGIIFHVKKYEKITDCGDAVHADWRNASSVMLYSARAWHTINQPRASVHTRSAANPARSSKTRKLDWVYL
jgi:hypothetical protein